jgi:hypothetical protein
MVRKNMMKNRDSKYLLLACGMFVLTLLWNSIACADWYNYDYSFRQEITINSGQVPGTLTNFPVLIKITNQTDTIFDNALNSGLDILFTSSNGATKINHEIEYYSNSGTKELDAWVKIPLLTSNEDTIIYIYYGNPYALDEQNTTNVWDVNFKMVQHLSETNTTNGDSNDHQDSTSYNNDGEQSGSLVMTAEGAVDGGDGFDGVNDYINCGNDASLKNDNYTIETWIKAAESPGTTHRAPWYLIADNDNRIYLKAPANGSSGIGLYSEITNKTHGISFGGATVDTNAWQYIVIALDGDQWSSYVDGVHKATETEDSMANLAGTPTFYIGGKIYFKGLIDEVRVSDSARSAAWITTTYNTIATPDSFLTFGSETAAPARPRSDIEWYNNKWLWRQEIAIQQEHVSSPLVNFPVLVSISTQTNKLFDYAQASGDDILFCNSDGTNKLAHEIEVYTNAGTKSLIAWVNVPLISASEDTSIFMYYGNSNAINQENVTNVWGSNYKLIQHMNESVATAGSDNDHQDSTRYNNDGEIVNSITMDAVGIIGGADQFVGSDTSYINCGDDSSLDNDNYTISTWVKASELNPPEHRAIWYLHTDAENRLYIMAPVSSGTQFSGYSEILDVAYFMDFDNTPVDTNAWQYVVGVFNGDQWSTYIDGQYKATVTRGDFANLAGTPQFTIGGGFGFGFSGLLDEIRMSDIPRNAAWIYASYINQSSPNTFLRIAEPFAYPPKGTMILVK